MRTKYYFHGGPLDGTLRKTGGCNPWRYSQGPQRQTIYVLHYFTAGPKKRYGIYVPQGAPRPSLELAARVIDRHGLEPETVTLPAGVGVRA